MVAAATGALVVRPGLERNENSLSRRGLEIGWEDADDRVALVVQLYLPTDNSRVPAETIRP